MRKTRNIRAIIGRALSVVWLFSVFLTGCAELQKPKVEPFLGKNEPPALQEFRWSNGKLPKTFDPQAATAPPETDLVRAIYEGLTDTDAKTLEVKPAIATSWEKSADGKTWTFYLRKTAKWTNGEPLTAEDFVKSWRRIAEKGEKSPNYKLFTNIVGFEEIQAEKRRKQKEAEKKAAKKEAEKITKNETKKETEAIARTGEPSKLPEKQDETPSAPNKSEKVEETTAQNQPNPEEKKDIFVSPVGEKTAKDGKKGTAKISEFGVKKLDSHTLEVKLLKADDDFPVLVAHTAFRPIYGNGAEFDKENLPAQVPTSGAFRIFSSGKDGIVLEKSNLFWDKEKVALDRVKLVPTENAENALNAYRAGEIDALTNARFEPLAIKLIAPYKDYKRTPHSALNLYEFNRLRKPFDDRRVREALNIAVDRKLLADDTTDGISEPAETFLPKVATNQRDQKIEKNVEKARELLREAGFPDGKGFPEIKLLLNRNDLQRRVARSVAAMWEKNLGIKTKLDIRDWAEYEKARTAGDFDIVRRGVVFPTLNETVNLSAIFKTPENTDKTGAENTEAIFEQAGETVIKEASPSLAPTPAIDIATAEKSSPINLTENETTKTEIGEPIETPKAQESLLEMPKPILTEDSAMSELPAIPLYFATSQSLVKPYVKGFETNIIDAPSLKDVQIETNWQPPKDENNWLAPIR